MASITVLTGFHDPRLPPERWNRLLDVSNQGLVALSWQWQVSWWESFGRGRLLLVAAESAGEIFAVAPLFVDGGMIYNICPEDALDFLGDISDPDVLPAMLRAAREAVIDFIGFQFYFIPETSETGIRLAAAAREMKLNLCVQHQLPSPLIDLSGKREAALAATRKQSLMRHEKGLLRTGTLRVLHMRTAEDVLPELDAFFDQHSRRRAATPQPSMFNDERQRQYYRRLTGALSSTGWLRFTRLEWNGQSVAFHFGACRGGRYFFAVPSFEIALSRQSPGEVLLRQLLLAALDEGADKFDFGIGDEAYKYRFATDVVQLTTWGLFSAAERSEVRNGQRAGSQSPP